MVSSTTCGQCRDAARRAACTLVVGETVIFFFLSSDSQRKLDRPSTPTPTPFTFSVE